MKPRTLTVTAPTPLAFDRMARALWPHVTVFEPVGPLHARVSGDEAEVRRVAREHGAAVS